jgi:hypothetical protein
MPGCLANGDFVFWIRQSIGAGAVARKLGSFALIQAAQPCEGRGRAPSVYADPATRRFRECPTTCCWRPRPISVLHLCVMLPRYTLVDGWFRRRSAKEGHAFWVKRDARYKVISLDAQLTRRLSEAPKRRADGAALRLVVNRTIADLLGGLRGWLSAARRAPHYCAFCCRMERRCTQPICHMVACHPCGAISRQQWRARRHVAPAVVGSPPPPDRARDAADPGIERRRPFCLHNSARWS